MTITQTITDPGTAPTRTDPDSFDSRADSFLTAIEVYGGGAGEFALYAGQANALATTVNGYKTAAQVAQTAAEAAEDAAEAAEDAAVAASNATQWLVGTTYAEGAGVWGSDSKTYRSAQGSNTGHDPVGDGGTWWVQISGAEIGANSDITSMTGLSDDGIPHAKIANLQGNKNAIINGDFNIWQRGTSFAAIANGAYSADRFKHFTPSPGVCTVSRDTDVPTQAESGHKSNYSLKIDVTTIDASIDAGDYYQVRHVVEGYNYAPFEGKTATLSFWVKSVKTGIYCVSFQNTASDRSYVVEYTINSASTWEKKTVTLTFNYSGGTWDYTNGAGIQINFALGDGANYQGIANTWNSANDIATSNQVNFMDSTDNNFWLAQVQFELGSVATDFEYQNYQIEKAKALSGSSVVTGWSTSSEIVTTLSPRRNAIINGDFNIWQRGTSFAAIANATYSVDRMYYMKSTDAIHTVSRDTDVPTQSESGHQSNYSLKIDCTTIDGAIAASEYVALQHSIEGYNFVPFVGKTATLSFWVKAVKTGTYCVAFMNKSVSDRNYIVEYTVNSASTWEKKTVTLAFDYSGGTWDYTNGAGLLIRWSILAGTDWHGTADTWNSSNVWATSNQVNGADSTDNNFWLAQVQLELGSVATDFEYRQYADELAKCQRYYNKSYDYATALGAATGLGIVNPSNFGALASADHTTYGKAVFSVRMRTVPTIVLYDSAGNVGKVSMPAGDNIAGTTGDASETSFMGYGTNGAASTVRFIAFHYTASAEL